ncbi:hypothetical protein COV82_02105 [Candidatus Peregrinibacteria bacterium CG11_big_fil_rev_8_21_14_0_20_46_8]|nr:MAG: hypothetical protein COV82_02105 [Candidatus Peregrinibacteria bacterium CG11_big_fil_rev_8_21_14_0_20_46_8]
MLSRLAPLLVIVLLLASCGAQEKEQHAASQERNASKIQVEPGTAPIEQPTSFEDGDVYFEAAAAGDASLCAKISDAQLRQNCADDLR